MDLPKLQQKLHSKQQLLHSFSPLYNSTRVVFNLQVKRVCLELYIISKTAKYEFLSRGVGEGPDTTGADANVAILSLLKRPNIALVTVMMIYNSIYIYI